LLLVASMSEKRTRKPTKRFDEEHYPAGAPRRKGKGHTGLPQAGAYVLDGAPGMLSYPQQSFVAAPSRPRTSGVGTGADILGPAGVSDGRFSNQMADAMSLLSTHLDASQQQMKHAAAVLQAQQDRKCNCKNSKCLKLYCECFASGKYCDGCNCRDCHNNNLHEDVRQVAVASVLERNPNAFRPKVQATKAKDEGMVVDVKHNRGCNCKKSYCLKKYCECFQAGVLCTESCRCQGCRNYQGSAYQHAAMQTAVDSSPEKMARNESVGKGMSQMGMAGMTMIPSMTMPVMPALASAQPMQTLPNQSIQASQVAFQPSQAPSQSTQLHMGPSQHLEQPPHQPYQPQPRSPMSPTLSLTPEQITTITSMCVSDVVNPTILKQTCMLMTLLADENLHELLEADTTTATTREDKVREICDKQKLAVDQEFVDTSRKILDTIKTKLDERREKFQMHQNTFYKFMSPHKRRWRKDPDPDPSPTGEDL
jgi:hypothetical protein